MCPVLPWTKDSAHGGSFSSLNIHINILGQSGVFQQCEWPLCADRGLKTFLILGATDYEGLAMFTFPCWYLDPRHETL